MRPFFVLLLLLGVGRADADPPAVAFSYNEFFDGLCSLVRGSAIKEEWKTELKHNQPDLEQQWVNLGPKLMVTTEKITGKQFTQKNITAHLTLCDLPSDSFLGAVVNIRYALASFTPTPVPLRYKISVLFHEILHKFLNDQLPSQSHLLSEHQSESKRVKNHLHLLALEKAVYLELGLTSELKEIIVIDGQLPGGAYKRAWAIVNQTDGEYLKYVNEISGNGVSTPVKLTRPRSSGH
jgi:hypothetical protein